MRRTLEKERFSVVDENGNTHEVIHKIEQVSISTVRDSTTQWSDIYHSFHLRSGCEVKQVSATEYELKTLGVKAKRV